MTKAPKKRKFKPSQDTLNARELLFVLYYEGLGTGEKSAIKAGYTAKDASAAAKLLLLKPRVAEAIERKQESALQAIEKQAATKVQIAAKEGFTLQVVFRNLMKIIEPTHEYLSLIAGEVVQDLSKFKAENPAATELDLNEVFKKMLAAKLAEYKPAVRDQDKIKAMELGVKILGLLNEQNLGRSGATEAELVRDGDKTFFLYRSAWRDNDGHNNPGNPAPALPPANQR